MSDPETADRKGEREKLEEGRKVRILVRILLCILSVYYTGQ